MTGGVPEDRLRQLLTDHVDAIARYFRRRVAADAVDEPVADVFTIAWRRIDDVPRGDGELAWLIGVARNVLAHHRRSTGRRTRLRTRMASSPPSDDGPGDPADEVAATDLVSRAAARLSPAELELLTLLSWEQLSPAELAVALDCSVNAVHIRVHRLRTNLRAHLDEVRESPPTTARRR